jgi:RHS repeat-associated protein
MAAIWLVAIPIALAPPARASSLGTVLILSTSVNGGTSSPEAQAATADGYSVTVASPSTWDSLTEANFASYSAIVIGDPSNGSCATTVPSDALSTAATWGPAVTGNVAVVGSAPEYAGASGTTLIDDAIAYAVSGSGTGLYVSLNCEYSSASSNTAVPLLAHVDGGGFAVQGQSATCPNSGTVNTLVAVASNQFAKLQSSSLGPWVSPACSVEASFDAWPSALSGLGFDAGATPVDFTASDGVTGQPYVLVGSAPSAGTLALSPSTGGEVPLSSTYGGSNPAALGYSQNRALVADPVDPATGDFTESSTDLSIPTYGPALDFTRTYDAQLAEQQTMAGTPGAFGYGSTDSWASSLSFGTPSAGGIYTIAGLRTDDGQGGSATSSPLNPFGVYRDSSGNLYIADDLDNRVEEIPATSGTHWGIAMTAGDIYTVAGNATGIWGYAGDGGPASAALLNNPDSVVLDSDGDLIIADTDNSRIQMVAAGTTTPYLSGTTPGDIYTIAGSVSGSQGYSGDGGAATSAYFSLPEDVTTGYGNNNLYIADTSNNRIQEIAASSGTQWGDSMTAGDIYTITGSSTGASGHTGDGGAATSGLLFYPGGVDQSPSGTLYIADSFNNRVQDVCSSSGSCGTADDIYTFAGSSTGASGHTGDSGAATSALLYYPEGVTTANGSNNVYIADTWNNRVQEVAASSGMQWGVYMTAGDIYTVAGSASGLYGYSGNGGAATSALLNQPDQVTFDSSSNMYIADTGNDRVREVSASTTDISAYAGNGETLFDTGDGGSALAAGLWNPKGIATDTMGDLFVADHVNNRVQEIAASSHTQFGISMTAGDVYTVAGGGTGNVGSGYGGPATSASIGSVFGVALDSAGDLYVTNLTQVLEVPVASGTQWGISMTVDDIYDVAGSSYPGSSGDGGIATSAFLSSPAGVTFDSTGDLYIADAGNNRVQEVASHSGTQWGIAMTANHIYTVAGSSTGAWGTSGDGGAATSALFNFDTSVALDQAGDIYIADAGNNRIQEVAASTGTQWGVPMTAGDVYTVAGSASGSLGASGDGGAATSALLGEPEGVTVDPAGDLYIADSGNNRIREVAAANGVQWSQNMTSGDIYTIAGSGTNGYSGDGGAATSADLAFPGAVVLGPSDSFYISDEMNNVIREVNAGTSPFPVSPAAGEVTVTEPTGAEVTFYPQVAGSCTSPYVVAGGYCALPQYFTDSLTYNSGSGTYAFSPYPTDPFIYNASGRLLSETDADGDTVALSYGSPSPGSGECPSTASSCNTVTSAGGRALVLGLNSAALVTSVTDPLGRRWTYAYNGSEDLTSVTDPMSRVTSYTYGSGTTGNPLLVNDLLTITKPNAQPGGPDAGDATVNVYNASGQVTSQTDPAGFVTTFNYSNLDASTGNGTVTETNPDGSTTVYDYESGALGAQSQWSGAIGSTLVSNASYGPNLTTGTLLDTWSTNGDVSANGAPEETSYTYDQHGNETSETNPLGETTTTWSTSLDEPSCDATATATSNCSSSLQGPAPVTPGGTITPPSSAPPAGVTYTEYDTYGNALYTTTGVYEPGAQTASYLRTNYTLYKGNTITLNSTQISCTATPPSPSLACATINADGIVTQLAYDSAGDLISSTTPDGNGSQLAETTYSYDGDGEQTATVVPDGNLSGANVDNYTTVTVYDSDGEVTSTTEAGGTGGSGPTVTPRTTYDYYDADGNLTSVKDPRGYTTTDTYNADDEETLVTDPDGNKTLTCYDGAGNVTETVPPVGVAANSLTPASCPKSYPSGYGVRLATDATTYTYDANGDKTVMTTSAPSGQSQGDVMTGADAANGAQPLITTPPSDETTTYTYDLAGNLIETIAPPTSSGGPNDDTWDTYDAGGELATVTTGYGTTAASTTSYCYDPNGDTTAVVAPDGNTAGVATCETSSPWIVSATSFPTQAAYQTTSSYDSVGELVSTTLPATTAAPSGITTSYTYDAQGNKLTSTDEIGVITTYTYSPTNLVASISYSGSSAHSVSYSYDADGNKIAMSDASGSSSFIYDPFGELTSAENGASQTVGYGYNADGEVTGITYPLPGTASWATTDTVAYGYDSADLLTSVTDFNNKTISISNTADGLQYSETLGSSGDSIATTYDATDSPSAIDLVGGSTTLLGFSYTDAPSGAILAETDTPSSPKSPADYTYDSQSRVTSMTPGSGSTLNYGFDASANLTTLPPGATGTYDHAGELTSSVLSGTTTSYTYNADGERLSAKQGSTTIASGTWNGAGELTSYSNTAANMSAATYDGDGRRTSETSTPSGGSQITQNFVWNTISAVPNLLMDSTNAYIFAGSGTPAEQVNLSTGTIVYLVADSLGSVRGAVASSGSLSGSVDYDAWGNPETAGGLSSYTPFGFAGAYTDLSGIVYLIGRYYDPQTGQFLSVDPEVQESLEAFGYAGDDPVDGTDPTGDISCGSPSNCKAILRHNANAKTAFTYFLTIDHFTAAQAAGFVGNFEVESGVNPDCLGGTGVCLPLPSSAPSEPVGIAQWLPPRSTELFAFAADLHVKPSAVPHDLTLQLEFVSDELGIGPFHKDAGWREVAWANSPIRSAPNPASAAENVARYYEGAVAPVTPTNPSGLQDLPDRQHFAEAAYALW